MDFLGDFNASSTVHIYFTTHDTDGAPIAPSSAFEAADVKLYKDGSATDRSSTSGWTMTSPFDSVTGLHQLAIDLSDNTDSGFYAAGSRYVAVLAPDETVDALAVVRVIGMFTIEILNKVNVTQIEGSDATNQIRDSVVDDATRIDASALNTLSGHDPGEAIMGATDLGTGAGLTTLATAAQATAIEADTQDIQARLPAALTGDGNIKADVLKLEGSDPSDMINAQADQALSDYDGPTRAEATADKAEILAKLAVIFGTAQGAGTGDDTLQLAVGQVTGDDDLNGMIIAIVAGAGAGQQRAILDSDQSDNEVQVDGGDWEDAVDSTSVYVIFGN